MLRGERRGRPCEGCLDLEVWKNNKKRSLEKQEIETAPSLLRRHTRTVSPPPLPAFVFLPPKHFWPLALAALGLRVDDKRKYTPRIVFWRWLRAVELLKKNSSWETRLQGQCYGLPGSASSRNATRTWTSRAALAPTRSSPASGGLSSDVGPPTKRKSQLGLEQSPNPAALPPALPQDLA